MEFKTNYQDTNSYRITSICFAIFILGLMSVSITHAETYTTNETIGFGQGTDNLQFSGPCGISIDSSNNLYVVEKWNNRIQKIASNGDFITKWGSLGNSNGSFSTPTGIAIDSSGNIYIADSGNNRIEKFDSSGKYITNWGSWGIGNGQFKNPRGVAVDSSGNVFVADSDNNRIQEFNSDGTFISQWGEPGSGIGQLENPYCIAIDSTSNIYVIDLNNRVQKFDSNGKFITQWGSQGSDDNQFNNPSGITIDSFGNVYVADSYNNQIKKFDSSGNLILLWGTRGTGNGQLGNPCGVAVDSSGNVYVSEFDNNRIQMFSLTSFSDSDPLISNSDNTNTNDENNNNNSLVQIASQTIVSTLFKTSVNLISLITALLTIGISFKYGLENTKLPVSHAIGILGFPQSGKTTMITSIFGEIFAGRILSVRAVPKGAASIERINENLAKLQKGRALGPTKDQDRFSFRADVKIKGRFPPRNYKVEFGDFPGEDSEEYAKKYGHWVHNTEYFKWIIECEALIFVIDIGKYLLEGREYVTEISSAYRAAWQQFLDVNKDRRNVQKIPVVLSFTKADLFDINQSPAELNAFEEEIMKLGFGDTTRPVTEINKDVLDSGKSQALNDFRELIEFFKVESSHFEVLFISCFGLQDGIRIGLNDLLKAVLP